MSPAHADGRAPGVDRAERAEMVAPGVVRFLPVGMGVRPPSLALVREFESIGKPPEGWSVWPGFLGEVDFSDTSENGYRHGALIEIDAGTSLYGTGEVAGPLERHGRVVVCWNSDCAGYDESDESLYQSHPWVLCVRADGSAFGVLADTTWRCEIDLEDRVLFRAEGEPFAVYVVEGESAQEVLTRLGGLIGRMELPPLWALGYHQCRYSYETDARVREVADGFRWREIPCDAVWMDIDYMHGFRVYTFDHVRHPYPEKLSEWLHERSFRGVWMVDPGVASAEGYTIYEEGCERDVWVRDSEGEVATGRVWPPEPVAFPDFTRPDVRDWWAGLQGTMTYIGADGLWNDMNEPAILDERGATLAGDCVHGGGSLDAHEGDGRELPEGPHARYHNVYGMLMARATREGLLRAHPERRPFVLTRAGYLGSHRYAATWTGDNRARWADMRWSISMALNLGLSGQAFVGPDIGGFLGDPTPGLFARWMGIGALLPFARAHADKLSGAREPWSFGLAAEATCRRAIERRYRLLPYIYTLFREASETGLPVVRPVFFADPSDATLRAEEASFLLGGDVLVQARVDRVLRPSHAEPSGVWRAFDVVDEDPELPVMRLRPGAIVPAGPVIQHTGEWSLDPLTLYVSLDERGEATGELYEDAGDGYEYRSGAYRLTRFHARLEHGSLRVWGEQVSGDWGAPEREIEVRWACDDRVRTARGHSGNEVWVSTG